MKYIVKVYVDNTEIDQEKFVSLKKALRFADDYQDRGFKVRLSEVKK